MNDIIFSGFSDEACPGFEEQLQFVSSIGVNFIEVRGVDGKNVAELTEEEAVLAVNGIEDCKADVAIRPEGFVVADNGVLTCKLDRVEVMGRDISIVSSHQCCQNENVRAIIGSENLSHIKGDTVRFSLKPEKGHIFNKENGNSIVF